MCNRPALVVLHKEYEPTFFFWELVELAKKLIFVGFAWREQNEVSIEMLLSFA